MAGQQFRSFSFTQHSLLRCAGGSTDKPGVIIESVIHHSFGDIDDFVYLVGA